MQTHSLTEQALRDENAELRLRLAHAQKLAPAAGHRDGDVPEVGAPVAGTSDSPAHSLSPEPKPLQNRFPAELFDQSGDSVIVLDVGDRLTYLNAAAERRYGVRASDLLGREIEALYSRQWPSAEAKVLAQAALREGREWRGEMTHRTNDGRDLYVESTVTTLRDRGGAVTGWLSVSRDITERTLAYQAVRSSEQFLQRMADVTPGVLHVFDLQEQRNLFINRSLESLLGYSPDEVQAMGAGVAARLMHPEDLLRFESHLQRVRALADGEIAEFQHRMRDRGGQWHWFHSRDAVFARDASGAVLQLIGSAVEITARKQAEEALQRAHEKLQNVLGSITDGLLTLDRNWCYTYANEQGARMIGMRPDELVGRCVWDLFPEAKATLFYESYHRAVDTRQPVHFEEYYPEPLNLWLACRCYPSEEGLSVYFQDVTERKRAETELGESEARFRAIADSIPQLAWMADGNGHIGWFNSGWLDYTGTTCEDNQGAGWKAVHHPDHVGSVAEKFERHLREGRDWEDTFPLRGKDGEYRWFLSRMKAIRDQHGKVLHFFGTNTDVTEHRLNEEALRASEERFRSIFENAATGIAISDMQGRVQHSNPALSAILGYSADELRLVPFGSLVHPDDRERNQAEIDRLLTQQLSHFAIEHRYLCKDGRQVWVHKFVSLMRDAAQIPNHIFSLVTDITKRKRTEDALRASEERLRLAVSTAKLGQWEIELPGLVLEASNTCKTNFGKQPGDSFTYEELWQLIHPDDRSRVQGLIHRAIESRTFYDSEYRIVWPDGSLHWILARGQATYAPDGSPLFISGVTLDITERRLAEEALRDSERQLRYTLQSANAGAWDWTIETGDIAWSPESYKLYDFDPAAPTPSYADWLSHVHPEDRERMDQSVLAVVEGVEPEFRTEFRVVNRKGQARWLMGLGRVERDATGKPVRMSGINIDITDRMRAQEQLRNADRRKDEFLATLAHELRNPLAPVRNVVQLLHMKSAATPELQWATDVIDRQMQSMTRLIDDLMDVSRISRGNIELKREHVELATIIQGAVETSRPLIEECGHDLRVTLPSMAVIVDADLTRLAQVFMNLLNNAAKYTDRGGRIDLRAEQQGSDVVVTVKDTGIGIPPDRLSTIFDMFSQVESALSRSRGGLGIGLSLVKRLVEMHGGRVEARSEGPNHGSELIVRLPIVVEIASALANPAEDEAATISDLRILVVDDNRDAAASLAMLLETLGNTVAVAHDGEEAVAMAETFRPRVMLCDIGMPRMNGYEACRRIRQTPWGQPMLLIAVTGWGQDDDKRKADEAGFDHHLVKPVDPQALMDLLAALTV